MQDYLIFIVGNIFSCFITSFIVFQYMDEVYDRIYKKQITYILLQIAVSIGMVLINLMESPVMNLICWIAVFCMITAKFYDDSEKKIARRIMEIVVLFLVLAICESLGYVVLEIIIWKFQIIFIPSMIKECLKVTFSKLSLLVLYYLFVTRIWKSGRQLKLTIAQYIVYCLIIVYSILNLSLILISVSNIKSMDSGKIKLLLINMFGIVFIDLFFLCFTKFTEENSNLKMKLSLLEQQANIQYKYYEAQEEKYNESIVILHDVGRHLSMIEGIYKAEKANGAKEYTQEIREMLQPLIPQQYTNNPILNILLNDKKRSSALFNIDFELEIGNVDLAFMEPIEVTTLFGNLLDNAIEACQQLENNRFISMKLDTFNDFIAVHIVNCCCGNRKWSGGKPISDKVGSHGIGLINVENIVSKYNGSIILEEKDSMFSCNIILNG